MSGKASSYNLSLIAAYRLHPMLYDNRHRDYKVQNPTKEAWADVAKSCNSSPDECRARWKALRDRYIKERKKRQANSHYKVAWPLYAKMEFLEPFIENANKKDLRILRANTLTDLPRRTIENVVELLVREAQCGGTIVSPVGRDLDVKDSNTTSSSNSAGRPEAMDTTYEEGGHELERFYLKLISEVRQHQLLFDSSNSLYRVTAARNRVWEEIATSFGDGYAASELRTKWRSIRDRYIRERRLYKESLHEGKPRFPKWSLYPEFAFLDFYVDQSFPRSYAQYEPNDNDSLHSGDQPMHVDTEEADQSSPSSASSTPSTTIDHHTNAPSHNGNMAMLQMFQRLVCQSNSLNGSSSVASDLSADNSNGLLLNNLATLIRPSRPQNNSIFANSTNANPSNFVEGLTDVITDVNRVVSKLSNLQQDLNENGVEHSFGNYVAVELMRTPEPRRSDIRRSILSLLSSDPAKVSKSEPAGATESVDEASSVADTPAAS